MPLAPTHALLQTLLIAAIHEVVVLHRKADHLNQTWSARLYEKKVVNVPEKERWQIYPCALNSFYDCVRHAARYTREFLSDDSYPPPLSRALILPVKDLQRLYSSRERSGFPTAR